MNLEATRRARALLAASLTLLVFGCNKEAEQKSRPPHEPDRVSSQRSAVSTGTLEPGDSGARLKLEHLFYNSNERLEATLELDSGRLDAAAVGVFLVSPHTGDLELLELQSDGSGRRYTTVSPVPLKIGTAGAQQLDGALSADPGELLFAVWYPDYDKEKELPGEAEFIYDFAQARDPSAEHAPATILESLAMTDDESERPEGGKPLGTLLLEKDLPLQVPVNELILYPDRPGDLERFLAETGGTVVATDPVDSGGAVSAYLVQVQAMGTELEMLGDMRALLEKEKTPLYASNLDVLKLVALAMRLRLEGYSVSLNPRLQYMAAPEVWEGLAPNGGMVLPGDHIVGEQFGVDRAWTLTAMHDVEADLGMPSVSVAFLDHGFAPNPDFRGYPDDIPQCNFQEGTELNGYRSGFSCGNGTAVSTPTVGNSFFGNETWHGNHMVATAGAVVNNGYGAAGVAGQVMQPILYRFGRSAFAFEMGLGVQQAVADGASVINISAGYPCSLPLKLGLDQGICTPLGRAEFCTKVTASLVLAANVVCAAAAVIMSNPLTAVLFGGPAMAACVAASATVVTTSGACFATLFAGDVRGTMQRGVAVAAAAGIPVVSCAGNRPDPTRMPSWIVALVNLTNFDAATWEMIPCTLHGVICAGSADDSEPYPDEQFNGPAVDIWAPRGNQGFAPPSTTEFAPPELHVPGNGGGGTSGATAYISGVLALMQANNPDLDPQRTTRTGTALAAIPDELLGMMQVTALPPHGVRGPLVRPFRAVELASRARTAGLGLVQQGYLLELDFDEDPSTLNAHDTEASARMVSPPFFHLGAIHYLPAFNSGLPGWPPVIGALSSDSDWFRVTNPNDPNRLWKTFVEVRSPEALGRLNMNSLALSPLSRSTLGLDEVRLFETAPRLGGTSFTFGLGTASAQQDNVYEVYVSSFVDAGAPPPADRFDTNDPAINPYESLPDNDAPERAVQIGAVRPFVFMNDFAWQSQGPFTVLDDKVWTVNLGTLSFHKLADKDQFLITQLPDDAGNSGTGPCAPRLHVITEPEAYVRVFRKDGPADLLVTEGDSPLSLTAADVLIPLRVELTPRSYGEAYQYTLEFRYVEPNAAECNFNSWNKPFQKKHHFLRRVFPKFYPQLAQLSGTPVQGMMERVMDEQQRVVSADSYAFDWSGEGPFRMLAQLEQGTGIRVALKTLEGIELGSANLDDADPAQVEAGGLPSVLLELPELAVGTYVLSVSHGSLSTRVRLQLQ